MPIITVEAYACTRCDHVWLPRGSRAPKNCPRCKSPYWDVPRTRMEGKPPAQRRASRPQVP